MKNIKNKFNNFIKIGFTSIIVAAIAGCSVTPTLKQEEIKPTVQPIVKKYTNGEMVFNNDGEGLTKNVSYLVVDSVNLFNKLFPIKIIKDNSLKDGAQAARVYTNFEKTDECIISVNVQPSNVFESADMNYKEIQTFIYLHEIAHCADTEKAPEGVSKDDWLESLADGYAALTMLRNESLNTDQLSKLATHRKRTHSMGAYKMNQFLARLRTDNTDKNQENIIEEVREIRRKIFKM